MDDQFPDMDRVFPRHDAVDVMMEVSRSEVLEATRRAMVVADAPGAPVRLVATPDAMLIGSSGGDGSAGGVDEVAATVVARENMALDNEDKPYLVRLSLRFFADSVRVAGSERVRVGLSGMSGPIVIAGIDTNVESLVMPMNGV
jgi:DNA polymerase III sliding clamp (beta) subunit (PCNA family)